MIGKYENIFRTAAHIIEQDYAGQPECSSRDHAQRWLAVLAALSDSMLDNALFVQIMNQYFAEFQDPSLAFEAKGDPSCWPLTCGFSVRRFEDALYVTAVREESRLNRGDCIIALDGNSLDACLASLVGNPVNGVNAERQLWDSTVPLCATMLVRRASGEEETLAVERYPKPSFVEGLRPPAVEVFDEVGPAGQERAAVIALHHFVDGSVLQVMQENFAAIQQADRVIIDVRGAEEGMIGNAYALLALFFTHEINLKELMGERFVYTRYTPLNARLRHKQLARMLELSDASGKEWVQAEIDHVAACAEAGFVKEAEFEENMLFPPAPAHQKTFLLTDVHTCRAAERLVAIAQRASAQGCGKVACVGRATRGGLDYSSLLSFAFDETFSMVYPMSKTEAAHQGFGTRGRGLSPEVYVPFTPEECCEDIVLKKALAL